MVRNETLRADQSEVERLNQGDHLCLVYDGDPVEQMPALAPFLRQGLAHGEQCVYVADDFTLDQLIASLTAHGIDVDRERARGALLLWTREQWRQPGELDPARKEAQVRGVIDAALASGFSGVRFGVEMTWTLAPDIEPAKLQHWESRINSIFTPDVPARIVCQYSRRRLSTAAIRAGLATHPLAVFGTQVMPNPYFEPCIAEIVAPEAPADDASARLDWMMSRLHWARAFESERAERMRVETALEAAEHMKSDLEQLNEQLVTTAEELRRANASKDEFLGLLSHEVRTPITVILGNAHVLLRTMTFESQDHQAALQDIRAEAERLDRIVSNLLVLSKLETGHEPEMEPLSPYRVIERAAGAHRLRRPEREVRTAFVGEPVPVFANLVYVEQVMVNLLSNAEKYSARGQVIDVEVTTEHDRCVVRVLDRGIGFGASESERLFDAFYRSDGATRTSAGIGIGLAVCKRLVEAQGGEIWARPRDGGGAEFGFSLALCEVLADDD